MRSTRLGAGVPFAANALSVCLILAAAAPAQPTARPTISSLSPASMAAGSPGFTLGISGDGFVPPAPPGSLGPLPDTGSQVQWNNVTLNTTFISNSSLTAAVPPGLIVLPDRVSIVVVNPGQIVSNAVMFTITGSPPAPLAILTALLPVGTVGAFYSQVLTAAGGVPPYNWSLIGGPAPPGLTLDSSSGTLAGIPSMAGQFSFTVQVTDSAQTKAFRTFSITIVPAGPAASMPLTITSASPLPDGTTGSFYSQSLTASGGTPPYTWSVITGLLPPGFRLDAASGTISGTTQSAGTFDFTVQVVDSAKANSTKAFSVTLNSIPAPLVITTKNGPLPAALLGHTYSAMIVAAGGTPPYSWSIAGNGLPPGLTLNPTAGILGGIPSATGSFTFTIEVSDKALAAARATYTLEIESPVSVLAVTNAASYLGGPIAPGTLISIFGAGMGPEAATSFNMGASGSIDTALAGIRVLFDGTPAPLIFGQDRQINAVAPYSIVAAATSQMQVEYNGIRSAPVPVAVAASAPAIFTLDSSGKGQGAILNEDTSLNSLKTPARPESIVVLFATGAGQTDPPGTDGRLATSPLPKPVLPVSVTIGGLSAEVIYAGSAPGEVAGMLQLNVRIPAGAPTGDSVPVLLTVGEATSQPGVTLVLY